MQRRTEEVLCKWIAENFEAIRGNESVRRERAQDIVGVDKD
jgi:hypothetical protein